MTTLKDIKNFSPQGGSTFGGKGILNMPPESKAQAVRRGVADIVL